MSVAIAACAFAAAAALAWGLSRLKRIAAVGAGYKAKVLCSAVFVSGLDADGASPEVSADSYRILRLFPARVDRGARRVEARLPLAARRAAVYRPGLGATLAPAGGEWAPGWAGLPPPPPGDLSRPWPEGEAPAACDPRLEGVLEAAFAEPDPARLRRTRAVLVARGGRVLAERYAPGISPFTPLPGWSMTKSVIGALAGVLVGEGKLALDRRALLPEWRSPGDPRAAISLEDLLRMRSGLRFAEVYSDPLADVTQMLFARPDAAGYAAARPLEAAPGTLWKYSSGTTNIVSRIIREAVGEEAYPSFPRRALFEPLGMRSAVLEPDASGTFVGSSFMLATARDWARFGQLYLDGGVRAGRRILPEGWVRFGAAPTPQAPEGRYGAHWWLKLAKELGGETPAAARIPAGAFHALGHEGQALTVIPSRGLVVVRLGLSIYIDAWDHAAFLAAVLDSL